MNDTNHETKPNASPTPGPWVHGDNGLIYGQCISEEENESPFVCDVISDEAMRALGILSPQEEANARLIAAAPKLLTALASLDRMSRGLDWCDVDEQARRWHDARVAIAEATGRSA